MVMINVSKPDEKIRLQKSIEEIKSSLQPVSGKPLHFTINTDNDLDISPTLKFKMKYSHVFRKLKNKQAKQIRDEA